MSYSGISIVGYVGHDPVAGQTAKGMVSSRFSVATTERRKTADGERRKHTSWFRITAYGRLAEIAQSRLAKGRRVFVRGRLRLEEYTDREGRQRFSAEVTATDILLLDATKAAGGEGETIARPK
ncbi:MAG TPA: single-stranded DNA-binding protein [Blastocatellia bacterium]|nr:single-stranded DNA-binding protein [Blastocatellia bacterium]